jgi:hypothetical protein
MSSKRIKIRGILEFSENIFKMPRIQKKEPRSHCRNGQPAPDCDRYKKKLNYLKKILKKSSKNPKKNPRTKTAKIVRKSTKNPKKSSKKFSDVALT